MGYRHYFKKVEKSLVEKLNVCKTEKEVVEVLNSYGIESDEDYINITDIGGEIYEFGKYYENAECIIKKGKPLFISEELQERFSDYLPIVGNKDLILDAIEWQKNHIIKMYEDLVNNNIGEWDRISRYEGKTDEEIQFDLFKKHIKTHLNWWKPRYGGFTAINTDLSEEKICDSWMYEHTIFELVRLYKSFDDEKYCILFIGW